MNQGLGYSIEILEQRPIHDTDYVHLRIHRPDGTTWGFTFPIYIIEERVMEGARLLDLSQTVSKDS